MAFMHGVRILDLETHVDERGDLTEVFRQEWQILATPVQWNIVSSAKGVLRGVHLHVRHADYLLLLRGKMTLCLRDLRDESPSCGEILQIELSEANLRAVFIPPGVAHGFYFHQPSIHFYSVSEYWSPSDELGCLWSDPELGFSWPAEDVLLSERDRDLPPMRALLEDMRSLRSSQNESPLAREEV
jgi:dTDP-4-dehydrorhamnose 3,5-epimerase